MKQFSILISILLFLSLSFFVSWKQKPKIIEIEKPIEKIIYQDRIEYKYLNLYLTQYNINKVILFYQENSNEDYEKILDFYDTWTNSRDITNVIIEHSIQDNVPINLMFAMARQESSFNPKAENRNSDKSYDRGLFQLNSKSRKWKKEDYYDIERNTKDATGQMKWLLTKLNKELAIAAFNAGYYRIKRKDIPYDTFVHIINIIEYEQEFDIKFSTNVLPNLNISILEPGKIQLGKGDKK